MCNNLLELWRTSISSDPKPQLNGKRKQLQVLSSELKIHQYKKKSMQDSGNKKIEISMF